MGVGMTRQCTTCAAPICRQNKSGLCRSCSIKRSCTPELVEQRAAKWKARIANEPALKAKLTSNLASCDQGYRLRRLVAAKLPDWLPVEYRSLYRELMQVRRLTKSEVIASVRAQMEVDKARYAATGQLQVAA